MNQPLSVIRKSCFTNSCCKVMDFFLSYPDLYFTPRTAALSLQMSPPTVKDCMNILKQNFYLSKLSDDGTVYHITSQNMEFWRTDFTSHLKGGLV